MIRDDELVTMRQAHADCQVIRESGWCVVCGFIARLDAERTRADALTLSRLDRLDRLDPRVNVLRLLAGGLISVGKACEALNELADGRATLSPLPIAPDASDDADDAPSWKARAEQAEARLNDLLRKRRWLNVTPLERAEVELAEVLESGLALLPTFDDPAVFETWKAQARAALAKALRRA